MEAAGWVQHALPAETVEPEVVRELSVGSISHRGQRIVLNWQRRTNLCALSAFS